MNRKRLGTLVVLAVIAISAGVGWRAREVRNTAMIASDNARRELAATRDTAKREERRIAELAGTERRQEQAARELGHKLRLAALLRERRSDPLDPAFQVSQIRRYREGLRIEYFAFYRAMGWGAAEIADFENILTRREESRIDLGSAMQAQALANSDPAVQTIRREDRDRFRAGLASAFGEGGLGQFDEYQRKERERRNVGSMIGALALGSSPLEPKQIAAVIDLLRRAQPEAQTIEQGRGFLDPAQLSILESHLIMARGNAASDEILRLQQADRNR